VRRSNRGKVGAVSLRRLSATTSASRSRSGGSGRSLDGALPSDHVVEPSGPLSDRERRAWRSSHAPVMGTSKDGDSNRFRSVEVMGLEPRLSAQSA